MGAPHALERGAYGGLERDPARVGQQIGGKDLGECAHVDPHVAYRKGRTGGPRGEVGTVRVKQSRRARSRASRGRVTTVIGIVAIAGLTLGPADMPAARGTGPIPTPGRSGRVAHPRGRGRRHERSAARLRRELPRRGVREPHLPRSVKDEGRNVDVTSVTLSFDCSAGMWTIIVDFGVTVPPDARLQLDIDNDPRTTTLADADAWVYTSLDDGSFVRAGRWVNGNPQDAWSWGYVVKVSATRRAVVFTADSIGGPAAFQWHGSRQQGHLGRRLLDVDDVLREGPGRDAVDARDDRGHDLRARPGAHVLRATRTPSSPATGTATAATTSSSTGTGGVPRPPC